MRAAYDALDPAARAKVEGLSAHQLVALQPVQAWPPAKKADGEYSGYGFHDGPVPLRPLVKIHPETGRKSLLIGRHATMSRAWDKAESERFLEGLVEFAASARAPTTTTDAGRRGDLDNRCLLHQATPWDMTQPRVMWHSRIAGDPMSEGALATEAAHVDASRVSQNGSRPFVAARC